MFVIILHTSTANSLWEIIKRDRDWTFYFLNLNEDMCPAE